MNTKYVISYVTNSGTITLNYIIEANSYTQAIAEVKDESMLILSVVKVTVR
jgi:hypothetical protein